MRNRNNWKEGRTIPQEIVGKSGRAAEFAQVDDQRNRPYERKDEQECVERGYE